jgi:hypothetical protein
VRNKFGFGLKVCKKLAKKFSITKAAPELFLTQLVVIKYIRKLKKELNEKQTFQERWLLPFDLRKLHI